MWAQALWGNFISLETHRAYFHKPLSSPLLYFMWMSLSNHARNEKCLFSLFLELLPRFYWQTAALRIPVLQAIQPWASDSIFWFCLQSHRQILINLYPRKKNSLVGIATHDFRGGALMVCWQHVHTTSYNTNESSVTVETFPDLKHGTSALLSTTLPMICCESTALSILSICRASRLILYSMNALDA